MIRGGWPTPAPDPAAAALAELAEALGEAPAAEWARHAACKGSTTDLHHPTGREGSPGYRARAELAKRVCATCPVVAECLDWALEHGEDEGIWGATTPAERRAIRRRDQRRAG